MALIEAGKCKIEKLDSKGFGVGKGEKGLVELPYLLPGDEVEFERHAYRGKGNCVAKSAQLGDYPRSNPPCEHFGDCGGCLLQHLTNEDYQKIKLSMVTHPLKDAGIQDYQLNPTITVPYGNRRRANLEAIKRQGELYFGFHAYKSFRIANINSCLAMEKDLSNILAPLRNAIDQILEDRQKGQVFLTKASNGIDLWFEIQNIKELSLDHRNILKEFAISNNITRLIFRHRKNIDIIHETEEPYILFDGLKVEIDAHCFLQASSMSDEILSEMVLKYAALHRGKRGVDLFCGRGTYTLPLSKNLQMDGFESDIKALTALSKAAGDAGRDISLFRKDLFSFPVKSEELQSYDFCVINPPRAGSINQIKELAKAKNMAICYISCNPETFARDARILLEAGYRLKEVTPLDQFYYSPHMEMVGYFVPVSS